MENHVIIKIKVIIDKNVELLLYENNQTRIYYSKEIFFLISRVPITSCIIYYLNICIYEKMFI